MTLALPATSSSSFDSAPFGKLSFRQWLSHLTWQKYGYTSSIGWQGKMGTAFVLLETHTFDGHQKCGYGL